jgi:hypothetical protein
MEVWLRRLPSTAPPIVNVEAGVSQVRSVDPLPPPRAGFAITAINERKAGEMVVDLFNHEIGLPGDHGSLAAETGITSTGMPAY